MKLKKKSYIGYAVDRYWNEDFKWDGYHAGSISYDEIEIPEIYKNKLTHPQGDVRKVRITIEEVE